MLAKLERDDLFFMVAEVDGEIVASADIQILFEDEKSVGTMGMVVERGFSRFGY
jgi:hypothetical protein